MDKIDLRHASTGSTDSTELDDKCDEKFQPTSSGETSMTVIASDASVEDLHLMRAVPCSALLSGFARHFSQAGPSPFWRWEMSHACANIYVFVSHSWKAPRWQKYFALSMSFNGKAALIAGYLASLAALVLQAADILPAMGAITSHKTHTQSKFSVWCLLAACLTHLSVLMFWQTLACKFKGAFLDRLCICQTDPQLKIRGIKMLGAFIGNSTSVLVLLDPSYFTRLWCVLEVAAFIHKAGADWSKSMDFRPLDLAALIVGLSGAGWFSSWLRFSSSARESIVRFSLGMLMFAPIWVPASLKYVEAMMLTRETLKHFHIGMARCSLEEDRVLICNSIKAWFGSVKSFEEFIRRECRRAVAQQVGSWNKVSWWYFLFMGLPRFAFECDVMAGKIEKYNGSHVPVQRYASRIIYTLTSSFILPAVWFRFFFPAVRKTLSIQSLWFRYALIAGVGIVLMTALQVSLVIVHNFLGLPGNVLVLILFASLAQAKSYFHSGRCQMTNLASDISSEIVEMTRGS